MHRLMDFIWFLGDNVLVQQCSLTNHVKLLKEEIKLYFDFSGNCITCLWWQFYNFFFEWS